MFERLMVRVKRGAEKRAAYRMARLAEAVQRERVGGVEVRVEGLSMLLAGRGLRRRFALDPALRWLTARLR